MEPSLVFEGNRVFSEQELLNVADKCLARGSPSRDKYETSALEYCLRRVKWFLNGKGYLQAVVGTAQLRRTQTSLLLVASIEEGPLYRLGEIRIIGSKIFSATHLLQMSGFKPGDIADGKAIGAWLFERVPKAYAALGYLQYTAEPNVVFHLPSGTSAGLVDLTVTVEEGEAFIVRSIKFEGNGSVSARVLQSEMLVGNQQTFIREYFDESIRRLNKLSLFEKIDPDKDVNYKVDNETAQLDITIRLKKRVQP